MPRYYFDIRDGDGTFIDEEGVELEDMEAAISEARKALSELLKDSLRHDGTDAISIAIRDGREGSVVLSANLSTVFPEKQGTPS